MVFPVPAVRKKTEGGFPSKDILCLELVVASNVEEDPVTMSLSVSIHLPGDGRKDSLVGKCSFEGVCDTWPSVLFRTESVPEKILCALDKAAESAHSALYLPAVEKSVTCLSGIPFLL